VGGTPALEKAVAFDVDSSTSRENDNRRTTEAIKAGSENNGVEYVHSNGHLPSLDEFEDDGFVVMEEEEEEDYENNYESKEETHDEEDVCFLCQDGGDLIVCNGGDNLEGCGRNFHVSSSRSEVTRKIGGDESDGSLVVLPQQKSKVSVWDSDDD
jgi:hypothetical protein